MNFSLPHWWVSVIRSSGLNAGLKIGKEISSKLEDKHLHNETNLWAFQINKNLRLRLSNEQARAFEKMAYEPGAGKFLQTRPNEGLK